MILVGNMNHLEHKEDVTWFYIGRNSVLGNPYSHLPSKYPEVIKVKTAEEAVEKYRLWLWKKIKEKDVPVLNELSRLKEAAQNDTICLLCWCVDKDRNGACHGYVIKSCLEWMMEQ